MRLKVCLWTQWGAELSRISVEGAQHEIQFISASFKVALNVATPEPNKRDSAELTAFTRGLRQPVALSAVTGTNTLLRNC